MSKIRAKNTKPELLVRKILWKLGYRYRIHKDCLPGKPDIYIPKIQTVIFVHGCFWHQHEGCKRCTMPKSHFEYWTKKLNNNVVRFSKIKNELITEGYKVFVIWECETKKTEQLTQLIERYLKS